MHRAATLILALAPALASCGPAEPPGSPEAGLAPALESPEVGLRFTELPEGVRLVSRDPDRLVLDAVADGVPGNLVIAAVPPAPAGVNLVEEANAFGNAAATAGGEYFGGQQIVTPYGSGFVIRVRDRGGATEELRVFLLHPGDGDRLLTLSLGYPPGEPEVTRSRFEQVVAVLEALEPLGAETAAD